MHIYVNGNLRPEVEIEEDWTLDGLPKSAGFSGSLELGRFSLGDTVTLGTMSLDEILIWEEELLGDDIIRLYHAYA